MKKNKIRQYLVVVAFIVGLLGFLSVFIGFISTAMSYVPILYGILAAASVVGYALAIYKQRIKRITGSLLMMTVSIIGYSSLYLVPEVNEHAFCPMGVHSLIIVPTIIFAIAGLLYFIVGILDWNSSK